MRCSASRRVSANDQGNAYETDQARLSLGFTLLEILLVVIIIGMLVGVAVVNLGGKVKESKITATRDQIHNYESALDLYELDNGVLPNGTGPERTDRGTVRYARAVKLEGPVFEAARHKEGPGTVISNTQTRASITRAPTTFSSGSRRRGRE